MKSRRTYLVQTDTTAGFLSQDLHALNRLKGRDEKQPCLKTTPTCKGLMTIARVPKAYRRYVRLAKHTTFQYPNKEACRLIKMPRHQKFLTAFTWMYSTSANATGKRFEYAYAIEKADIIVEDREGFYEAKASTFIRLGRRRQRKIR